MKVIEEMNKLCINNSLGIALGNFDGIHLGHQKLINTLINKSKENQMEACLFTFRNHPMEYFMGINAPKQITPMNMKIQLFEDYGIDILILTEFNEEIMSISPEVFVEEILVKKLNCKFVVVGFDYRFGHKAKGDVNLLHKLGEKFGFLVHEISPVVIHDEKVSSTRVRKAVIDGDIQLANQLLGRYFSISSHVIHGKGRGRGLGYPTANLLIEPSWLLPAEGVYASFVRVIDKIYMGATCIGNNPTFGQNDTSVETFILDFDENLYNKPIEISFVKKLRDNIKFESPEALKQQMMIDITNAKKYLQGNHNMLKY